MSFSEVTGDLFAGGYEAIGHGCNCKGVMGAGIAAEFARRWPEMAHYYNRQCARGKFTPGDVFPWYTGSQWVYNLATQDWPGADARLPAIRASVRAALAHCAENNVSQLALPRVGAGIGGLAWGDVRKTLRAVALWSPVELIVVGLPGSAAGSAAAG